MNVTDRFPDPESPKASRPARVGELARPAFRGGVHDPDWARDACGVAAVARRDAPGVYVASGRHAGAKLGAVGLRVKRHCSYHGLAVNVAMDLAPFAGIMFLWFVAVVRSELGHLGDRFFETVFLGSGLLFVAMLFAAAAVLSALLVLVDGGRSAMGTSDHPWAYDNELPAHDVEVPPFRIDTTAVDAYWWSLLQRHDAASASRFRAVGATLDAPTPPLVCAAGFPPAFARRLTDALTILHEDSAARIHLDSLAVIRFDAIACDAYAPLAEVDRAARAAGYPLPA